LIIHTGNDIELEGETLLVTPDGFAGRYAVLSDALLQPDLRLTLEFNRLDLSARGGNVSV
jgi:hypothetical protein